MTKTKISHEAYIVLEEAIRNSVYSGMDLLEEEFEENKGSAENVIAFVMGDIQSHLGVGIVPEEPSPELPLVSDKGNFSVTEENTAWMIKEPREWSKGEKVEDESESPLSGEYPLFKGKPVINGIDPEEQPEEYEKALKELMSHWTKVEDESPDEVMDESDWELVKTDMRDSINKEIIQVLKPRMMICDYGTDIKLVEDCVENAVERIVGSLTD